MEQKILNARMVQRHDSTKNWNNINSIPEQGEIIIYDDNPGKIKVGDGKTPVSQLSFLKISEIAIQDNPPENDDVLLWLEKSSGKIYRKNEPLPYIKKIEIEPLKTIGNIQYTYNMPSVTIFPDGEKEDFYIYSFGCYDRTETPELSTQILKFSSKDNSVQRISTEIPIGIEEAIAQVNPEDGLIYLFVSSYYNDFEPSTGLIFTFDPKDETIKQIDTYDSTLNIYRGKAAYYNGCFYLISYDEHLYKYDIANHTMEDFLDIWQINDNVCDIRIKGHYAYIETGDQEGSDSELETFRVDLNTGKYFEIDDTGHDSGGDEINYYSCFFYNDIMYTPSKDYGAGFHYYTYKLDDRHHNEAKIYGNTLLEEYPTTYSAMDHDLDLPIATSEYSKKYNCVFAIRGRQDYVVKIYFYEKYTLISDINLYANQKYPGSIQTYDSVAEGTGACAISPTTKALSDYSFAEGCSTRAFGEGSHAEGWHTKAEGDYSHSEGSYTKAIEDSSHAEGNSTKAIKYNSHSEGRQTLAIGYNSHAEGDKSAAFGYSSHSEGDETLSIGISAHSEGEGKMREWQVIIRAVNDSQKTVTLENVYSAIELEPFDPIFFIKNDICSSLFYVTSFDASTNIVTLQLTDSTLISYQLEIGQEYYLYTFKSGAEGDYSHSEGSYTKAIGDSSHAEGNSTKAIGNNSHSEGLQTLAIGYGSHTEGNCTTASEEYSHSEGDNTTASAIASHAEGENTRASGEGSHSEGSETIASNYCAHAEGSDTTASGWGSHAEGWYTEASLDQAHAEGESTIASGENSHAEGNGTIASGQSQHVQGEFNIEDDISQYAHIIGNGTDNENRSNAHTLDWDGNAWYAGKIKIGGTGYDDPDAIEIGDTVGQKITAGGEIFNSYEGQYINKATGKNSHAEGVGTIASGHSSHAEGNGTIASGSATHASGLGSKAIGNYSHTEGNFTTSSGSQSHAEGLLTIAASNTQHVQGKYNIEDNTNKYAHIVGNGKYQSPSNAHTLDWTGKSWYAGHIYSGGTSQDDPQAMDLVAEILALKEEIAKLKVPQV